MGQRGGGRKIGGGRCFERCGAADEGIHGKQLGAPMPIGSNKSKPLYSRCVVQLDLLGVPQTSPLSFIQTTKLSIAFGAYDDLMIDKYNLFISFRKKPFHTIEGENISKLILVNKAHVKCQKAYLIDHL